MQALRWDGVVRPVVSGGRVRLHVSSVVRFPDGGVEVLYGTHRLSADESVVMCLSCESDERLFAKFPIFDEGSPGMVMHAVMEHLDFPGDRTAVAMLAALASDVRAGMPLLAGA